MDLSIITSIVAVAVFAVTGIILAIATHRADARRDAARIALIRAENARRARQDAMRADGIPLNPFI
jgi:hypothetical protein